MVLETEYHNLVLAACCSQEVVSGGDGFFFHGFCSTSSILNVADCNECSLCSTASRSGSVFLTWACIWSHVSVANTHESLKCDVCSCACISLSLSTSNFTATDCTLQADNPVFIFLHNTGESSNQTRRSRILLACCASTRLISTVLGFSTACWIADFVISRKTILGVVSTGSHNAWHKCRAIASHSRSSSVASHTLFIAFEAFLSAETTAFLSLLTSYVGSKSASLSIASFHFARSTTCHILATTSNHPPRYFLMVFAFAGDSTITNVSCDISIVGAFARLLLGVFLGGIHDCIEIDSWKSMEEQ